jgi:hypothetical protein
MKARLVLSRRVPRGEASRKAGCRKSACPVAALAATVLVFQSMPVRATCIIAPDGKSINVVTDNGSSDEKSCQVSCKVDTKIGVVSVSCGGNTPPLAKDHSLCAFDKTEVWYKKSRFVGR